uniref:PI-PLC X domain-containing protein At5g67130-like n=1 Tax=Rhizophora mucronata TaxID=61149 RepID=A0A2P2NL07_RHIMU
MKPQTLSWLVMESCWFVGERIIDPVADLAPNLAYELWVVSHVYRLNGKPFTFEVGITGWILVQRGRRFPFATHVSQCSPASQFLSATHVCPSLAAVEKLRRKVNAIRYVMKMVLCKCIVGFGVIF